MPSLPQGHLLIYLPSSHRVFVTVCTGTLLISRAIRTSQHLCAFHMDRITTHVTGHGNVVSLLALQCVRIINRQHFLVLVGNYHHLRAALEALLGAVFLSRDSAFRPALRIGNVAINSFRLVLVGGRSHRHHQEHHAESKTNQQQFLHSRISLRPTAVSRKAKKFTHPRISSAKYWNGTSPLILSLQRRGGCAFLDRNRSVRNISQPDV